ncbi:glycosyltransferase family 4 protein [Halioglobus sp.]|nr:glycosyltransferase family 4 protein [Halioglobus sp.]
MKIVKLHGSLDNLGGIVAFQRSLQELNTRSEHHYHHFQTGRVATSRLQSVSLFRLLGLTLSYFHFPFYLLYLRPDVIEINSSLVLGSFKRDYWYARIAAFVCPRARLVLFNHGWNDLVKRRIVQTNKIRLLRYFGFFDCIIVLAERFRRELDAVGVATQVEVITTAIDLAEFEGLINKQDLKTKRLLFLSRLEKDKGIGELLDSVPALVSRHPDLEIGIAGTGGYEAAARRHQANSVCGRNIRFYGYVRGDEKLELLASADLFIFPSYGEGCPVSVLEALAAGLPIVYTPVGALPDLLENGRHGVQVQPGSSREVGTAVLHLLDNPSLMSEMGEHNRVLSKKFDLRVIHAKLEEIYIDNG